VDIEDNKQDQCVQQTEDSQLCNGKSDLPRLFNGSKLLNTDNRQPKPKNGVNKTTKDNMSIPVCY
jgi:hypothetical protein